MLKIEQVNAAGNILINQCVTFKHIVQHFVGQGVSGLREMPAKFGEAALYFTQCAFNCWQIKPMRRGH